MTFLPEGGPSSRGKMGLGVIGGILYGYFYDKNVNDSC